MACGAVCSSAVSVCLRRRPLCSSPQTRPHPRWLRRTITIAGRLEVRHWRGRAVWRRLLKTGPTTWFGPDCTSTLQTSNSEKVFSKPSVPRRMRSKWWMPGRQNVRPTTVEETAVQRAAGTIHRSSGEIQNNSDAESPGKAAVKCGFAITTRPETLSANDPTEHRPHSAVTQRLRYCHPKELRFCRRHTR